MNRNGRPSTNQRTGRERRKQLEAVSAETDRDLEDLIRRRLALPIEKRMNFLRVRLPLPRGGSCL
jgi:hypothetical protein